MPQYQLKEAAVEAYQMYDGNYVVIREGKASTIEKAAFENNYQLAPAVKPAPRPAITETTSTPAPVYSPPVTITSAVTGRWEGDFWIEPDGYKVARRFVEKYPALYGPLAVDPDKGQGDVECDDIPAKIMAKLTGIGGTYSTSKERHCALSALGIGYNDVEHDADVPPCPKYWLDENPYWVDHIAIGRAAKKQNIAGTFTGLLQNKKVLEILTAALVAGGIAIPPAAQYILKFIGGS